MLNHWTPEEDAILIRRMANGERVAVIARSFSGRSAKAVMARAAKLRGDDVRDFNHAKALRASNELASAINQLFDRMTPNEVARVIGKPHLVIPGLERVYYGQGAERALAA